MAPQDPEGDDEVLNPQERERSQLVSAVSRAAAERGYRALTVEQVSIEAGLAPERFEAHFQTKEEGLIAAQSEFFERLGRQVRRACQGVPEWPDKVRAGLDSVLNSIIEATSLARAFVVEAPGESFVAAQRQFEALEHFASLLRDGRRRYPRSALMPELAERALVGGVASIVTELLLAEDVETLRDIEPQLLAVLLAPYLGPQAASQFAGA